MPKALTKDGNFGFAASAPDAFLVFARSKGAHYLDAKGQLDLNNADMKGAFAQYAALVSQDKVAPLLPASGVQSSSVANGRFTSGNVAMYVDGPWQLLNIRKKASFTVGMAAGAARREAGNITLRRWFRLRHLDYQQAPGRSLESDPGDDRARC